MRRALFAVVAMFGVLGVTASAAGAATIVASPTSITAGGTFVVSGDVLVNGGTGCEVPGTITLISPVFAGLGEFAGVGAVSAPVDATGHFRTSVTIKTTIPPGTYTIGGRCGGNLGVEATVTVTTLPRTGADDGALAAVGALCIACGALALKLARRSVATATARIR